MPDTVPQLRRELDETRARLAELEAALAAIRSGEVDGLLTTGADSAAQVFTLTGAQEPYRLLIEQMSEGALTMSRQGVILYANAPLARLLATPLARVIGAEWRSFVAAADQPVLTGLLATAAQESCRGELTLAAGGGAAVPVRLGLSPLQAGPEPVTAIVVSDRTAEWQVLAELEQRVAERTAEINASRLAALNLLDDAVLARDKLIGALAARRASEERYHFLFANMLDGFAHGRLLYEHGQLQDFVYLAVNPAFEKLTGLTAVVGKKVSVVIPGIRESGAELFTALGRVATTGQSERFENYIAPLGRWFDIGAYCPRPGEFVAVFHNITERKQAELVARRLAAIVESSADAMIGMDLQGRITSWNHGAERIFGYPASELLGTSIMRLITAERQAEEERILETIRQGGNIEDFDTVRQTKTGRRIDVAVTASPIKDANGQIIGVSKVARDVSERKRMEATLRENEARFRRYFETPLIGMAITSPTKGWLEVNDRLCAILGYSRAELQQRTWAEMTDPADLAADVAQFARIVAGEIESYQIEKRFVRKDGQPVVTELSVGCVRTDAGAVDYLVALIQDISQRTEAVASLAQSAKELRSKNAEMERFLYAASHDLKSPVVTVRTFLGYIEQELATGDAARLAQDMQFIRAATDKMVQLLDDLLEISRVGRIVGLPVPVTFQQLVGDAVAAVAGRVTSANVTIQLTDRDVALVGDRGRLGEIWQNLVDNACKFMGGQPLPRIEISITDRAGAPVFFVRDNGIGIDLHHHDKIFNLFERLDSETEGTGIGLALVRRIVEFYGGQILAESPGRGHGACFYFTLPTALAKPTTGGGS